MFSPPRQPGPQMRSMDSSVGLGDLTCCTRCRECRRSRLRQMFPRRCAMAPSIPARPDAGQPHPAGRRGPARLPTDGGRSAHREASSSEMGCSCQAVFSRSCKMIFAGSVSACPALNERVQGKAGRGDRFPVERSWPTSPGLMGFGQYRPKLQLASGSELQRSCPTPTLDDCRGAATVVVTC